MLGCIRENKNLIGVTFINDNQYLTFTKIDSNYKPYPFYLTSYRIYHPLNELFQTVPFTKNLNWTSVYYSTDALRNYSDGTKKHYFLVPTFSISATLETKGNTFGFVCSLKYTSDLLLEYVAIRNVTNYIIDRKSNLLASTKEEKISVINMPASQAKTKEIKITYSSASKSIENHISWREDHTVQILKAPGMLLNLCLYSYEMN